MRAIWPLGWVLGGVAARLVAATGNVRSDPAIQIGFRGKGVSPMPIRPKQAGKLFADDRVADMAADTAAMIKLGEDAHIAPAE